MPYLCLVITKYIPTNEDMLGIKNKIYNSNLTCTNLKQKYTATTETMSKYLHRKEDGCTFMGLWSVSGC